jgi:hypothetical protein
VSYIPASRPIAFDQGFNGARIQAEGFGDITNPQALRAQSHYFA